MESTGRHVPQENTSNGFTILELIVAIGVVALLVALLLPAVQQAREAARRTQCQSHLRQIATAIWSYDSIYRMLPPGAWDHGTWLAAILPQLEQQNLIEAYGVDGELPLQSPPPPVMYQCPSDPLATGRYTSYAGNFGAVIQRDGANGVFRHAPSKYVWPLEMSGVIRQRDISDGTSHTAMAAEVLAAPPELGNDAPPERVDWKTPEKLWAADEADAFLDVCLTMPAGADGFLFTAGDGWHINGMMATFYTHHLPPNSLRCNNGGDLGTGSYSPSSMHAELANVVFADGHVRSIASSISRNVWQAVGSRNGNDVPGSF